MTEAYDWLPRANKYFNTQIIPEMVTAYDEYLNLGVEQEAYAEFYRLFGEIIYAESHIRSGVKDVLTALYTNHKLHFVTAREPEMKAVTEKWLSHYHIPISTLSLLGSHDKVAKAHEYCCDIFIEDRYENAVQLSSHGFNVLLIDCYYNQGPLFPGITRVNDWIEIDQYIENYIQTNYYRQIAI
ncbi:hypothetical protein [uncultured Acetobacterium sp.]|uniref:5' nucleotidase, NT5C type n=1 Tax=uncultured Acetobacterium sp. TaxID=217139 RepID=UPI0025F9407C|nr:hypothetical protein [uncultured Acetobacterium sp.]